MLRSVNMSPRNTLGDAMPRVAGLLVFLAGIGLIVYVFLQAAAMFQTAAPTIPLPTPSPTPLPGATPGPATDLGSAITPVASGFVDSLRRLLTLLLMCIAASLIAALGIRLLGAARRHDNP